MNIDIQNYGHYRLTSHGGRAFDLFNRQNDKVYSIDSADYAYIQRSCCKESACLAVERTHAIRVVP